jgi:hypothetical protein
MRYVAAVTIGILAYAAVFLVMGELLHVAGDSAWHWLPFIASIAAVLVALRMWRASVVRSRTYAVAATAGSLFLVLAVDLFGGVWYSCAKGVCI